MLENPIRKYLQAFSAQRLDSERSYNLGIWILGGKVTDIQSKSKKLLNRSRDTDLNSQQLEKG